NQFAAAAAYYYRFEAPELERKQSIGAQDLLDACRLAGWRRMGDPAKTLSNAQGVGLLNKTERGQYTISSVGENLVAMTLSGETAKAPSKRHRKSKKKAKK
ncbi:MAG TPA: hypothetical protein VGQ94_09480, partial [Terriglobales bacterium]|nr:hypothetical protein [Terriglobales bacterium]